MTDSAARIAIVCSGLGHVQRGIEAWSRALAENLHADGKSVRLYHGGGRYVCPDVELRFAKRNMRWVRLWTRWAPPPLWRWGHKSAYAFEQRSFARALIRALRADPVDIVHTQDIVVAERVQAAVLRGELQVKVIFAHGTNEASTLMRAFRFVQHIAPAHAAAYAGQGEAQKHFVAPNFIDPSPFASSEDLRAEARRRLGLPADAFIVGCAGVLATSIKRIDDLIREFAALPETPGHPRHLLLAGAWTPETPALEALAAELLGSRCTMLRDRPFEEMPTFYRAIDLFALPCRIETFGICLVEAMTAGVPVLTHDSEVLRWVVGQGGVVSDLETAGWLARALSDPSALKAAGGASAQASAERFTWHGVRADYLTMYEDVMATA